MARIVKNEQPHHLLTVEQAALGSDRYTLTLIGPKGRPYLHMECVRKDGGGYGYISGDGTLRRLARAILRSLPPAKRKPRREGGAK